MYKVRLRGPADITPLADAPMKNIPDARRLVQKKAELTLLFAADRVKEYYDTQYHPMEY